MADSGDSVTKVPQIGDETPEAVAGCAFCGCARFRACGAEREVGAL